MIVARHWITFWAVALTLSVLGTFDAPTAHAQTVLQRDFPHRVALVIGNVAYTAPLDRLPNAQTDAEAISARLSRMGFASELVLNTTRATLSRAIDAFVSRLHDGDLAVIYYAGHGLNYLDVNYIVPVDAHGVEEEFVTQSYSLSNLLSQLRTRNVTNVVFIDACRDRPFGRSLPTRRRHHRRRAATAQASGGLGVMRTTAGTLLAFSTAPGDIAEDAIVSAAANSPFARALLQHIEEPRDIEDILREVRADVMNATAAGHQQIPWTNSALLHGVVLNGLGPAEPSAPAPDPAPPRDLAPPPTPVAEPPPPTFVARAPIVPVARVQLPPQRRFFDPVPTSPTYTPTAEAMGPFAAAPRAAAQAASTALLDEDFRSVPVGSVPPGWLGTDHFAMRVGSRGRPEFVCYEPGPGRFAIPLPSAPTDFRVEGVFYRENNFDEIEFALGSITAGLRWSGVFINRSQSEQVRGMALPGGTPISVVLEKRGDVLRLYVDGTEALLARDVHATVSRTLLVSLSHNADRNLGCPGAPRLLRVRVDDLAGAP